MAKNATKHAAATTAAAEWVSLNTMHPWVRNPRINDHKVVEIALSILRFGWGAPMLGWRDAPAVTYVDGRVQLAGPRIVAGHLRRKAILHIAEAGEAVLKIFRTAHPELTPRVELVKKKGKPTTFKLLDAPEPGLIPLRWLDIVGEDEYEALAIRDNGLGGDDDEDELARILAEHRARSHDMSGLGIEPQDLDRLVKHGQELLGVALEQARVLSEATSPPIPIPPTPPKTGSDAPVDPPVDQGGGEPASGASGKPAPPQKVISYSYVFDTVEQQNRFYDVLKRLKAAYPELKAETHAARLDRYFSEQPPRTA